MSITSNYILRLFGFDEQNVTPLDERKKAVNTFTIIGLIVLTGFSIFNQYMSAPLVVMLGKIQLAQALFLLLPTLLLSYRFHNPQLSESALVATGFLVFLTLALYGGNAGDGVFWSFVYPYLVFFLKGQRIGWKVGISYAIVVPILMNYSSEHWELWPYANGIELFYGMAFAFNVLVAAAFNQLRSSFQSRLWEAVEFNTHELKRQLLVQQHNATHDLATGLLNREGIAEEIDHRWETHIEPEYKLIVASIRFIRANQLSSIAGMNTVNTLLSLIATNLVRNNPHIQSIARHQHDELCLLIDSNLSIDEVAEFISNIKHFKFKSETDGFSLHNDYVFGIVERTRGNEPVAGEYLLRMAEQALLFARYNKQRYATYNTDIESILVRYHLLYEKLRTSISSESLVLHYQPQIHLSTKRTVGAEALVRWFDQTEGFISPEIFIPIIETSDLLFQFTVWTINRAISDCASWQVALPGRTVSINISADALTHTIVEEITACLSRFKLPPALVIIEITESVMLKTPEIAIATMNQLTALGVCLSIDDYGTGFSSLTYVKQLPAHELKIDKLFITDSSKDIQDGAIVSSTINLGHSLGLKVLAEGVEDLATVEYLVSEECDLGQGWHFAKAMPLADFIAWSLEFDQRK
jgi:EAL domain-containing protein (putative c-di-GMP-specific phosphodiesterase class I)/GGDEF domain-containing protein